MFNILNRVGPRSRAASLATPIIPAHHVHFSRPRMSDSGRGDSGPAPAAPATSPPGSPLRKTAASNSCSPSSPSSSSSTPSSSTSSSTSSTPPRSTPPGAGRQARGGAAKVVLASLADIYAHLRSADERDVEAAGKALLNVTTASLGASAEAKRQQIIGHPGFPRVVQLLSEGTSRAKILAAAIVSNLASTSEDIRAKLVDKGVVAPLLAALSSDHHCIQQVAVQALCNLSAGGCHAALLEAGAAERIIALMRSGAAGECLPHAVGLLNNISSLSDEAKNALFDAGAVPLLVDVLEHSAHAECRERAAYTLWNLSSVPHIRTHLFRIGAAKLVVRQLTCPDKRQSMGGDSSSGKNGSSTNTAPQAPAASPSTAATTPPPAAAATATSSGSSRARRSDHAGARATAASPSAASAIEGVGVLEEGSEVGAGGGAGVGRRKRSVSVSVSAAHGVV